MTIDTYGHLVPAADIAWVDNQGVVPNLRLPEPPATQVRPDRSEFDPNPSQLVDQCSCARKDSNLGPTDYEFSGVHSFGTR